jgi:hypothetical protein
MFYSSEQCCDKFILVRNKDKSTNRFGLAVASLPFCCVTPTPLRHWGDHLQGQAGVFINFPIPWMHGHEASPSLRAKEWNSTSGGQSSNLYLNVVQFFNASVN